MSFNTNWDIEKYKNNFESDEHWELRKRFMLTHKHKFPEDKLVCLAQTFYNIEVLGCTYPKRTMDQVEELAQDIAAEYRKRKKEKLQRTFIKASDAASAKIKASHHRPMTQSGTSGFHESHGNKSQEYQTMRPKKLFVPPAKATEAAEASHHRPMTQSGTSGFHESHGNKSQEYQTMRPKKLFVPPAKATEAAEASHHRPMTQSGTSGFHESHGNKSQEYQTMRPKKLFVPPAKATEAAEASHHRPMTQSGTSGFHESHGNKSQEYQTMRPKKLFVPPAKATEAAEASHHRPMTQSGTSGFHESHGNKSQEYQTMRPKKLFVPPAKATEAAEASHHRPMTQSGTSGFHESHGNKSQEYQTMRPKKPFVPLAKETEAAEASHHRPCIEYGTPGFHKYLPKNPFAAFACESENVKLLARLQFGMSDLGLPLWFIIMIDSKDFIPMNILEQSARLANIKLDYKFNNEDDKIECKVYLNELLMGQAIEFTKKTSRNNAVIMTIELLRKSHFVLEKKCNFVPGTLLNTKSCDKAEDIPLAEDNVGLRMMVKMGWTGSGLGQREQGIVAPVKATSLNVNRAGLGVDDGIPNTNSMRNKFQNIFREFSANDTKTDLVFSSDLSSLERKLLHELAHKFNLKSQSFGKGKERQLVISKPLCPKNIVYDLLVSGQMENEKYRLIKPENL